MHHTSRRQRGPVVKELVSTSEFSFNRPGTDPLVSPKASPPIQAKVAAPEKTYSEVNPEYVSLDLPSKFQFYSFKTLSARTLLGVHQAKFNRAHKEKRMRFLVEAVSSVVEPGLSAFDLTPNDFFFLMYWLKVNSYPKTPQLIEHFCLDEEHNIKVAKGEMDRESLRSEDILNMTTLDTKYCDSIDLGLATVGLEKYELGVETIRDVVEIEEYLTDVDEDEDITEYIFLSSYAPFIRKREGCSTVLERNQVIAQMTAEELELLTRYRDLVTNYGVEEFAEIKCRGCGASTKRKLTFDALSFLPNSR